MTDIQPVATPGPVRDGQPSEGMRGEQEALAIRANRALELRMQGRTYTQIGEALQCSRSVAHDYVQRALATDNARIREQRDEYRELHLQRIERLITGHWLAATRGEEREVPDLDPFGVCRLAPDGSKLTKKVRVVDGAATDRVLRLLDREARLLGLDAPVRVAVSTDARTSLSDLIGDLERMLSEEPIETTATEADPS